MIDGGEEEEKEGEEKKWFMKVEIYDRFPWKSVSVFNEAEGQPL